jgi:hypothetical protein
MHRKIFILLCFISPLSIAGEPDTTLVFELEKCERKNISSWKHPTRTVLEDAEAKIKAVYLCNKTYPVFVADFPYDPMSDETSSFFYSFYDKLLQANASWPYSIISDDKFVIHIKPEGTGIALDYDEFNENIIKPWLDTTKTF